MRHYVKDYEWDKDIGKGWVLVGNDNGPDLGVDVWLNLDECSQEHFIDYDWSRIYSKAEDEGKAEIQQVYASNRAYAFCALNFIHKLLKGETMNCFVKDHEWDEDRLEGSVLVVSDTGPELWVDVSAVRDEEGYALDADWNTLESEFQQSYDNCDAYFGCALDFIEKVYMQ